MADLVIRGIDLGNTMASCPFHADDGYGDVYCVAGHIDCHAPFNEHPEDCPVTILPAGHGRLIDADKIPYVDSDDGCLDDYAFAYDIREMPTIVPPEGGTNDG